MDGLNSRDQVSVMSGVSAAADICIIGAGVSGLTAGKALKDAGVAYDCYDLGSNIGGMWRYENDSGTSSAYRSLHIDSSRQSLAWPDFQLSESLPDYPSHSQMLAHFDACARRLELYRHCCFRTRVIQL